jgi:NADPH:quinone reductase-like Zn-dependent oxidoreductase
MLGHITDPSAPAGLDRREVPDPVPAQDEVEIAVRAYAVNRGELALLEARPDGWQPGQDVAGVVRTAAADGDGPAQGARVVALADHGGWSERVCVASTHTAELPDEVTFTQAAALPVAGLTALRALKAGGGGAGRRVLVTGVTGGVGHLGAQIAKAQGAQVTGLVSGAGRLEAGRALGLDAVVDALGDDTGPFDVVLDGVGGSILVDAIHHLAPGGTVVAYGRASGHHSELSFIDFARAPLGSLMGFFIYATDTATFGEDLGVLAGMIADGSLRPEAGLELDWDDTRAAVDALRRREVTGKVVLTIGE